MTEPLAWNALIWLSVVAQAWLAWRVVHGLRTSKAALRLPSADDATLFALRAACGVGAVGLGGHALTRALSGFSPNSSLLDLFNDTDAYANATPATTVQLANSGAAAVPPPAEATHSSAWPMLDWWMGNFFGVPGDPGPLQIHPDDGTGMKLARAAGLVVTLPLWGIGAVIAAAADEIRAGGPFHPNH
jgi:hypothetical protein